MKTIKYLVPISLIVLLFGCECDCGNLPYVNFTNVETNEIIVYRGDSYTFEVNVESYSEEVFLFEIDAYVDSEIQERIFVEENLISYVFPFTVSDIEENFTFKVVVYDSEDAMGEGLVSVKVVPQPVKFVEHTVTLGDQGDSDGSFLDLSSGQIYMAQNAKPNCETLDFVYYWRNTGLASFYSPQGAVTTGITTFGDLGTWATKHTTKFKKDNSLNYQTATFETVSQCANSATEQGLTQLATGDVVCFKEDSGLVGIIKIGTIVPKAKGIQEITFSYKIQENLEIK